jgi:hypothetical protein
MIKIVTKAWANLYGMKQEEVVAHSTNPHPCMSSKKEAV